jgi:fructokinase
VVKASVEDFGYTHPAIPAVVVAAQLSAERTRAVLLTAGAADTTIVTRTDKRAVPVNEGPVLDTIGAGDSFTAGFLTWWMESGRTVDDLATLNAVVPAVEAAHQVAVVVLGRRGADPPHRSELPTHWAP